MKTYKNLYDKIYSLGTLYIAWRNARKSKTSKQDVIEFEKNIDKNLLELHIELKNQKYSPRPLQTFILRDPKTRVISKSDFRDRIVHHAIIWTMELIFESRFIADNCANRIRKGTHYAIKRFGYFKRKVTKNGQVKAFCFKADIKQYFPNIDHEILLEIVARKIKDEQVKWLIGQILNNSFTSGGAANPKKGMPLGNLTSQFFANVYLNDLDYFVKHNLKAKGYIRYVDDFVILHNSREQLESWKEEIISFLKTKLKLEIHKQKSRIVQLSKGIDFVGFRNFYNYKLLRKRNIRSMRKKVEKYKNNEYSFGELFDSHRGWQAYAKWANTHKLNHQIKIKILEELLNKI